MILGPDRQLYFPPTAEKQPATPSEKQPAQRTTAQREASRKNGAKSQGPKTAEGKSRSRRNAMKHGLCAENLGPPADARGLRLEYKRLVAELEHEFAPRTFTERRLITALARDYQRLHVADRMLDDAIIPTEFNEQTLKAQYRVHRRARCRERHAADLLAALRSGETPDLSPTAADHLAGQLVKQVEQVEQDWPEAADDLAELADLEARGELPDEARHELSELRGLEALATVIKPRRRMLRDAERLSQAFRGDRAIRTAERNALILLVADIHRHAANNAASTREIVRVLKDAADDMFVRLADNPDGLMRLEHYRRQIEHAIARKVDSLRQACL